MADIPTDKNNKRTLILSTVLCPFYVIYFFLEGVQQIGYLLEAQPKKNGISFPGLPHFLVLWFVFSSTSVYYTEHKLKNKNGEGLGMRLTGRDHAYTGV